MFYRVRFSDGGQEHELQAATLEAAEAIVKFLSEAKAQGVSVELDDGDLPADAPKS